MEKKKGQLDSTVKQSYVPDDSFVVVVLNVFHTTLV